MRTYTLLLVAAGLAWATSASAQLPRIVVDGITAPQVFTDLNAAIIAAPANSNITLSGGSFLVPGGFALDKPLHFVGAGMHPDSTNATGATILAADNSDIFALTSGASGSSFTGIWFTSAGITTLSLGTGPGDQVVTGVDFLRCMFQMNVRLGIEEPSNSSSSFTECIFHRRLDGLGGTTVVNRCIFDWANPAGGVINTFRPSGLSMLNSVMLGGSVRNSENATFSNCVFTRIGSAPLYQCRYSSVSNSLISHSRVFGNTQDTTSTGNTLNVAPGIIFVNEADGFYRFTDDLHQPGGEGNGIGLYGATPAFKPGGVPHVPHFRRVDIARGTDANGNLPATVRVAAQPN